MNSCSISRRAQFIVIGQRREQVSLHSFCLSLSLFSGLSSLASSVFFYSPILLLLLPLICLWTLWLRMYIPLCSITPRSIHAQHGMLFCNVPHYQILPSLATYTWKCVCTYAMACKRREKELIFRVYCICTYMYMHTKKNYHIA